MSSELFGSSFSSLSHSCLRPWILLTSPGLSLYFIRWLFHADHTNLPRAETRTEDFPSWRLGIAVCLGLSVMLTQYYFHRSTVWARVGEMPVQACLACTCHCFELFWAAASPLSWWDSKIRWWQEEWPIWPPPPPPPCISLLCGHSAELSDPSRHRGFGLAQQWCWRGCRERPSEGSQQAPKFPGHVTFFWWPGPWWLLTCLFQLVTAVTCFCTSWQEVVTVTKGK